MTKSLYNPNTSNNIENFVSFAINRRLATVNTTKLCQVIEVAGNRYSVQPLVYSVDSVGNEVEQPIIHDVIAQQWRGSKAGVIIEYKTGDIVVVGFSDVCLDPVKDTLQATKPEESRKFALQDGIILGYYSNDLPTTYIKIVDDNIEIKSKNIIVNSEKTEINSKIANINSDDVAINATKTATIKAPIIKLDGQVNATSKITAVTSITAPSLIGGTTTISSAGIVSSDSNGLNIDGKPYKSHTHSAGGLKADTQTGVVSGSTGGVS